MKTSLTEAGKKIQTFAHRQGIFFFGRANDVNTNADSHQDDSMDIFDFIPEQTSKAEKEAKRYSHNVAHWISTFLMSFSFQNVSRKFRRQ
jgi:hypothetical protein